MRLRSWFVIAGAVLAASCFAGPAPRLEDVFKLEKDLKYDMMFPRRSYLGSSARVQGWSPDDRYLAYFWNPYHVIGNDLWIYDSRTGKTTQLTSPDVMKAFDGDAMKAVEEYKKDEERWGEWLKLDDEKYREERQKYEDEQSKRKGPPPARYSGPSDVSWAHKSDEFLMTYKGDIYRWKLGDKLPTRMTWTRDSESQVNYLPDDSGFVFRKGNDVYRMKFGSSDVVQINPDLSNGIEMRGFRISPDGNSMLVLAGKRGADDRQVDYITYRDRFAKAQKTSRGVSDDDFNGTSYMYLYDIRDEVLKDPAKEQKAFEVWKWAGGEQWEENSINNDPWSPDGKYFTFASWKRDDHEFKIWEADLAKKSVRPVYVDNNAGQGEHTTPGMAEPFYTKDGKNILALLDKSGWRQLHEMDRVYGKEHQVTHGDFDVYPQELSADGKSVICISTKEDLARMDVYRVSLEDGTMTRLSHKDGQYAVLAKKKKSDDMVVQMSSWSQLREMFMLDSKGETQLTDSHDSKDFFAAIKLKPTLFTYKNRHGDTIHGYMFLPPGYDKTVKRPLFVYTYGGPLGVGNSVTDGSFQSTGYMFNMYLAYTLGYVTCTIDPRGSSGYSAAFGHANWDHVGQNQTEDLVDLAHYMTENYNIDTTKVGLTGWSFGGFQTQHTMYNASDTYTLGIAGAGPTEWQNYNTWYVGGVIGNAPKGKGEELDKYSLTNMAKNLKNPLLLLHGMEDTNVLYQDTVHVYRKLLQAGKGPLVELALDPTGQHGLGGDIDTRDRHLIYLQFLVKWWGLPDYLTPKN